MQAPEWEAACQVARLLGILVELLRYLSSRRPRKLYDLDILAYQEVTWLAWLLFVLFLFHSEDKQSWMEFEIQQQQMT
jgi:hypothetical protein